MTTSCLPIIKCRGECILLLMILSFAGKLQAQPTISSFSPASGPVGTTVTITGTNFSSTPSNNIVFFGAVRANVSSSTNTSLNVTVPSGTTYQPITVTVNGLTSYSNKPFIVTFPGGVLSSASFEFAASADNVTGIDTDDFTISDIDNDGKPDLVTVDGTNGFFAVYRNTSTGSTVSFAPRINYQAGSGCRKIFVSDIDGDGKPDVITANSNDNTISAFRNTTTGSTISFAPKSNFSIGTNTVGLCVADFDLDGKPDIATISSDLNGTITVLKNTCTIGTVSFSPKTDFTTLGVLSTITATDINNDGKPDLVLTNFALNIFSVLRNTSNVGFISFAPKVDFASEAYPDRLSVGDLDGDNKYDIAISYFNSNLVSVYRNASSGNTIAFDPRINYPAGDILDGSTITDLDGDGKPDLAVINTVDLIFLFKNNSTPGSISLSSKGGFPSLASSRIMACDFDADNKPDIAAERGTFRVAIWRNKTTEPQIISFSPKSAGTGATITITGENFTGVTNVSFGGAPAASFTVVNSTTITAVVGTGASGTVTVSASHGIGRKDGYTYVAAPTITSFTPTTGTQGLTVTITGNNFSAATSVTFGGVAAASYTVINATTITAVVGSGASGNVSVTTPGGTAILSGFTYIPKPHVISFTPTTGTIGTTVTISGTDFLGATEVRFGGIPAGSFTVVSSTTINAVVLGGSSGSVKVTAPGGSDSLIGFIFIQPPSPMITSLIPTSGPVGTVVTITGNNFNTNPSLNYVYFGPARATVSSASANSLTVTVPPGAAYSPVSVTTNFLTAYSNTPFVVTFPDGGSISSNSFVGPYAFTASTTPQDACISDVDGDGKNDLIAANDFSSTISVLRNNSTAGTISFATKVDFYSNYNVWRVLTSEIDGDGKKDVVAINHSDKKITVLRNTSTPGSISFASYWTYSLSQEPWDIAAADFDNDGRTDFAVVNYSSLSVIRNTSVVNNISLASKIDFITPSGTIAVATGDIDRDGKADIVYLTSSGDSVYIMRNITSGTGLSFASPAGYASKRDFPYFGPTDVTIGDLDNDSKPEIIVANTEASRSISIFKNNSIPGVISFPDRIDIPTGNIYPFHLSLEDIDGDGKPDISFTHEYVPRNVSVIKNISATGNIAFAEHVDFTDNGNNQPGAGICTGDLDGDGRPEIIFSGGNALGNSVYVYKNKTNGPHITSFNPVNGIAGQSITITGSNFVGVTEVKFGGVSATSFTVNSPTSITAVLSTGSSGNITVTNSIGTASASGFLYGLAPTITSFAPTSAATGAVITITGTNFTDATNVSFGGQLASSFTVVSPTTITAIVGLGASGVVSVTVPGGTASVSGFTYIPPAPVINSFAPQNGSEGTLVTISGSNFTGTSSVSFGGVPASSFTVVGPSLITASVGNGASGQVAVTTSGGTGSKSGFTFIQPAPTIISFTPTTAAVGATITITGTNFSGATSVSLGGIAATSFSVISPTTITAVVGTGASGIVSVTTPGGTATKAGFTFIPAPNITSFSPASATAGTTITINGTNFTGATAVSFGGTAATSFTVVNATTITAVVATGASGNVSVTTPGGTASLAGFIFNFPTGLSGFNGSANTLIIYPNPSKDIIVVQHPIIPKSSSITIIDMYGRLVKEYSVPRNEGKSQLNIQTLPSGVYRIRWNDVKNTMGGLFFKN
jgi:hypothetical protein